MATWSPSESLTFPEGTRGLESDAHPEEGSLSVGSFGSATILRTPGIHLGVETSGGPTQDFLGDFLARALEGKELLDTATASSLGTKITSVNLSTRVRLRRIARESRHTGEDTSVEEAIERRAETLLERVWETPVARDEAFADSTFVTITGDGAVQFEWESELRLIEATVEAARGLHGLRAPRRWQDRGVLPRADGRSGRSD